MPYLIATDLGFGATLQKLFYRELSRRPVLLICFGPDLAMMEALNAYGRPFHQRATEMVPGADETAPLVAVSRNGASTAGLLILGPEELLTAYRQVYEVAFSGNYGKRDSASPDCHRHEGGRLHEFHARSGGGHGATPGTPFAARSPDRPPQRFRAFALG